MHTTRPAQLYAHYLPNTKCRELASLSLTSDSSDVVHTFTSVGSANTRAVTPGMRSARISARYPTDALANGCVRSAGRFVLN
jgi:hypothetical protein